MDAYDLPDELASLQSQDMGKIGFIQDLVRGIKKVLEAKTETQKAQTGAAVAAPGVESLMKRGWLFLEDKDWKQADEYFDRVLDIDPEYAEAYIGKLCAELKMTKEKDLSNCKTSLQDIPHFQKAIRFSDVESQIRLKEYLRQQEEYLQQPEYNKLAALVKMKNYSASPTDWQELAERFRQMNGYKDSAELAKECEELRHIIQMQNDEKQKKLEEEKRKQRKNEEERQRQRQAEEKRKHEEQVTRWIQQGLCKYCGSQIGGLFTKKCKSCGRTQ